MTQIYMSAILVQKSTIIANISAKILTYFVHNGYTAKYQKDS
jgi:hypothetical protein